MTKTETVIRSIFGAAGIDTRPLARAVDIAAVFLYLVQEMLGGKPEMSSRLLTVWYFAYDADCMMRS